MRQQWPKRFANALVDFKYITNPFALRNEVRSWLIESLEPKQREVYHYIQNKGVVWINPSEIVQVFKVEPNHAATILKALYDLHLLNRKRVIDEQGKHYEYTGK